MHIDILPSATAMKMGLCQSATPMANGLTGRKAIMRYHVAPAGVAERSNCKSVFGWQHLPSTYATMLKQVGPTSNHARAAQGIPRCDATADTYTQAIMPAKRAAQNAVLSLIFAEAQSKPSETCTVCTTHMKPMGRNE